MAVSASLAVPRSSSAPATTRRCLRAAVHRPILLVLTALYVLAACCATSPAGVLAGLAVVVVFGVRTGVIIRAELHRQADG